MRLALLQRLLEPRRTDWPNGPGRPFRWRAPLAVAGLLTAVSALLITFQLRPSVDLVALLPPESPAAAAYAELVTKFGTVERVAIMIRVAPEEAASIDGDPLLEAATRVEELLLASGSFRSVRAGIEPEEEAYWLDQILPRAALLLPDAVRFARVRDAITPDALRQRAEELSRSLRLPGGELLDALLVRDPLGFARELPGLDPGAWGLNIDPLTGTFRSSDGASTLLIADTPSTELDPAAGRRIVQVLEEARQILTAELGVPSELFAVGGPLYAAEDESLLRRDLSLTLGSSTLLCFLLLVLSFGDLRAPLIAIVSVTAALIWIGGVLALAVGSVAAMSLGFAAVLVGLGVDYSIHGLTRLRELRAAGVSQNRVIGQTLRSCGPAILASALTTAGAFALLGLATLRPLRELGLLVAGGMLAMLLSTLLVGAPLASLLLTGTATGAREGRLWRGVGHLVSWTVGFSERRPWLVLATALALLAGAAAGLPRLRLEGDLRAVRPVEHRTLAAEAAITATFDLGFDAATILVAGTTSDEALAAARAATDRLRAAPGAASAIDSPSDWLLDERETARRLVELSILPLEESTTILAAELRRVGLNPDAFATGLESLRRMGRGVDPSGDQSELPAFLNGAIHVAPGDTTVAIRVRPPAGLSDPEGVLRTALESGQVATPAGPGLAASAPQIATPAAIGRELGALARQDLEKLLWLATLTVLVLVAISFRGNPWRTIEAMLPATAGTVVALGGWGLLGGQLDLISVAVLPIMLGIGVDDGLHAVHASTPSAEPPPEEGAGATESRSASPLGRGVRIAGRAMVLTTLTTAAAFASLTLSSLPGLRRGGIVVTLGVTACLLASLFLLPALGAIAQRLRPLQATRSQS